MSARFFKRPCSRTFFLSQCSWSCSSLHRSKRRCSFNTPSSDVLWTHCKCHSAGTSIWTNLCGANPQHINHIHWLTEDSWKCGNLPSASLCISCYNAPQCDQPGWSFGEGWSEFREDRRMQTENSSDRYQHFQAKLKRIRMCQWKRETKPTQPAESTSITCKMLYVHSSIPWLHMILFFCFICFLCKHSDHLGYQEEQQILNLEQNVCAYPTWKSCIRLFIEPSQHFSATGTWTSLREEPVTGPKEERVTAPKAHLAFLFPKGLFFLWGLPNTENFPLKQL